jgi:hypothetical protein
VRPTAPPAPRSSRSWREKQREDRIRRQGDGYAVARVIWDDLDHPAQGRAIIREGLRQAEALERAAAA